MTDSETNILGLWEMLNNPEFRGVEIDPLLKEAGSHTFTMSPSRWIELTNAKGLVSKNGGIYELRNSPHVENIDLEPLHK